MRYQQITRVRVSPGIDWSHPGERLAELAAGEPSGATLQLVRIDHERAVLLASADERGMLARLESIVVAPWLAELAVAESPVTTIGETVWALERDDAWKDIDMLDDVARCEHFVHEAAAAGSVWGLYGETWARSRAAAGREALPLWPTRELAMRCISGPWATFAARAIELPKLLEQWLTGMHEDGIVAVVTPTPGDPGVLIEPDVLAEALRRALP